MTKYREAGPDDAEAIALLHAQSWRENYRGEFLDSFLDDELPEERLRAWGKRLEKPPQNQFVLLAVQSGELVGFVCVYGAHDSRWGSLIDNLHVAKGAQRSGRGTSLLRRAGAWLVETQPAAGVYLWALESNVPARSFYEHLGTQNAGEGDARWGQGAELPVWPHAGQIAGKGV